MKLWISRDKNGELSLFNEKPVLSVSKKCWLTSGNADCIFLDDIMFPEVTFENSPIEVELKVIEKMKKREEEIRSSANHFSENDNELLYQDLVRAYTAGAKWADETIIKRACEWLINNAKNYTNGELSTESLVYYFKKALGE